MRLPPLQPGRLVRRYQRFLADVALDGGKVVTAHCPNPGRMLGLNAPGAQVWLSRSPRAARRLPLTLELVEAEGGLVGINTMVPNRLAEEAIRAGGVPELDGYAGLRREVRYGERSRVDLMLSAPGRPDCYVEVKNVHWRVDGRARFPDAVTARGARHLSELAKLVAAGKRAVLLYVVQRADCAALTLADEIDPAYGRAFRAALDAGVEGLCRACSVNVDEIRLANPLPLAI